MPYPVPSVLNARINSYYWMACYDDNKGHSAIQVKVIKLRQDDCRVKYTYEKKRREHWVSKMILFHEYPISVN